jgi:hypothetical protein
MADDVDRMYRLIYEQLNGDEPLLEDVLKVIAAREQDVPHADWAKFRALRYDSELPYLRDEWLSRAFQKEPPVNLPVTGLWFGLFNPIRDKEAVTDFYVSGSASYELDSPGASWASNPDYCPEGRYAHSRLLRSIYRIAYGSKSGLGNDAEQFLCLAYVAFAVKRLLFGIDRSLVVRARHSVGVAVGWDSGDPLYIGTVTRDGFHPRSPEEAIRSLQARWERFEKWFEERYGQKE